MTGPIEIKGEAATVDVGRREIDVVRLESNGSPWWVRAIYQIGVPSAIALYLVWTITATLNTHVRDLQDTNSLLKIHIETTQVIERTHQESERSMQRILRAICVNGARTAPDRAGCLE